MWRTGFVRVVLASLLASASLLAQTGVISGSVMSAEGARPIGGAQVRVAGTTTGAITRDDGRYTIAVQPGTYTVRVSRIGFAPDSQAAVAVTSGSTVKVDFRLRESARVLTGMVVTGYGETEARDRTGSVDVVSSDEFNTGRVVSPEQLIQSKVAGVQVVDNNEPGGGISIRIRGSRCRRRAGSSIWCTHTCTATAISNSRRTCLRWPRTCWERRPSASGR